MDIIYHRLEAGWQVTAVMVWDAADDLWNCKLETNCLLSQFGAKSLGRI